MPLRTRSEIDQEYSLISRIYGDRIFKGTAIQNEIKALHDKMTQLSQEPAAEDKKDSGPTVVTPPDSQG